MTENQNLTQQILHSYTEHLQALNTYEVVKMQIKVKELKPEMRDALDKQEMRLRKKNEQFDKLCVTIDNIKVRVRILKTTLDHIQSGTIVATQELIDTVLVGCFMEDDKEEVAAE